MHPMRPRTLTEPSKNTHTLRTDTHYKRKNTPEPAHTLEILFILRKKGLFCIHFLSVIACFLRLLKFAIHFVTRRDFVPTLLLLCIFSRLK